MAAKYDVVVVGAGNAGLSAAVKCAVEGKRPCLSISTTCPEDALQASEEDGSSLTRASMRSVTSAQKIIKAMSGFSWKETV